MFTTVMTVLTTAMLVSTIYFIVSCFEFGHQDQMPFIAKASLFGACFFLVFALAISIGHSMSEKSAIAEKEALTKADPPVKIEKDDKKPDTLDDLFAGPRTYTHHEASLDFNKPRYSNDHTVDYTIWLKRSFEDKVREAVTKEIQEKTND